MNEFISGCSGILCLCSSCANEVNNRDSAGEMVVPCFHCEDECYHWDHGKGKFIANVFDCPNYVMTKRQAQKNRRKIGVIEGGMNHG